MEQKQCLLYRVFIGYQGFASNVSFFSSYAWNLLHKYTSLGYFSIVRLLLLLFTCYQGVFSNGDNIVAPLYKIKVCYLLCVSLYDIWILCIIYFRWEVCYILYPCQQDSVIIEIIWFSVANMSTMAPKKTNTTMLNHSAKFVNSCLTWCVCIPFFQCFL